MERTFTAIVQRDEDWWVGWIEEIPGVNSQGLTRDELVVNLRSALVEALEMNREAAREEAGWPCEMIAEERAERLVKTGRA
jgi:predicted RNase H-like HicB family nuclease